MDGSHASAAVVRARAALAARRWEEALRHLDAARSTPDDARRDSGPASAEAQLLRADATAAGVRDGALPPEALRAALDSSREAVEGRDDAVAAWLRAAEALGGEAVMRAWAAGDTPRSEGPATQLALFEIGRRAGWGAEAVRHLRAALSLRPGDPALHARLARVLLRARVPERAAEALREGLRVAPHDPALLDALAATLAQLGPLGDPTALAAVRAAPSPPLVTARRLVALGDVGGAEELLAPLADADALAARAHLRLWALDLPTATALADAALSRDPQHAEASLVLGAVAALGDAPEAALPLLGTARPPAHTAAGDEVWLTPDVPALWHATALRRAGRLAEARPVAASTRQRASRAHPALDLVWQLAATPADDGPPQPLREAEAAPFAEANAPDPYLNWSSCELRPTPAQAALLRQLGGNLTPMPTVLTVAADGSWRATRVPRIPPVRERARALQSRLAVDPPTEVLAAYDALHEVHGHVPTAWTYYGEVLLWLGDLAGARRAFQRAGRLHRETTWAWIGLGAVAVLDGDAAKGLKLLDVGAALGDGDGPSALPWRTEALMALGRWEAAADVAEAAVRDRPSRLSSWIHLGLLEARGHERLGVTAATALGWLGACAPGLLAAARSDLPQHGVPGGDRDAAAASLRAVLGRLAGNRSSSIHTWQDGAALRFVRFTGPLDPARRAADT